MLYALRLNGALDKQLVNTLQRSIALIKQPPLQTLTTLITILGNHTKPKKKKRKQNNHQSSSTSSSTSTSTSTSTSSNTWTYEATKSVEQLLRILTSLNTAMMCCVLPEYILNSINSIQNIRIILTTPNAQGN